VRVDVGGVATFVPRRASAARCERRVGGAP
jgi:hypothetical protein